MARNTSKKTVRKAATKRTKTTKSTKSAKKVKKPTSTTSTAARKGPAAFVSLLQKDKELQALLKSGGFSAVLRTAKRRGFSFTQAQLTSFLKKKFGITKPEDFDDPDTCTIF